MKEISITVVGTDASVGDYCRDGFWNKLF